MPVLPGKRPGKEGKEKEKIFISPRTDLREQKKRKRGHIHKRGEKDNLKREKNANSSNVC